jgi:hypothetical protein
MEDYREVLVRFWGEEKPMQTLVSVGKPWSEDEDDPRVFFYFADEAEFERAKLDSDEFEFQIVD